MYCRFCGTEISDQSQFCTSCGRSQDSIKRPTANICPMVLRYIIGMLFVIGGVLPYLLQEDLLKYNDYIKILYNKYPSIDAISAISCFTKFSAFLSPIFYFTSSVLAIYLGFLILKKESKLTFPAIACAIVHIVSIIYSGVINLLIYAAPQFVLSLYTNDEYIITAGAYIINSEPDMLYYYQDNAVCRLIVSVILIALVVIFLFIKRQYADTTTNTKTSTVGNVIMILSVSVLSVVSTALSASLAKQYYGDYAVAANAFANSSFIVNISFTVIFMFVIILCVAVLFTRVKRWILAIPTISMTAILGFIAVLLSDRLLQDLDTPAEVLAIASDNFRGLIISSAVILIAMFYWFSSVSRNKIPMWLQIVLPISLPIIYVAIEVFTNAFLHLNLGISGGLMGVAIITMALSLLARTSKPQTL